MKRIVFSLVLSLALSGVIGYGWHLYQGSALAMDKDSLRFKVEKGASLDAIVAAMNSAGLEVPRWQVAAALKLRSETRGIKAGVYQVDRPTTLAGLLDRLVKGDALLSELLIVEGWSFKQLRARIAEHPDLLHDSAALGDAQLLESIGASESQTEGLFFPSTYRFAPGSSDLDVFRQAYKLMKQTLAQEWDSALRVSSESATCRPTPRTTLTPERGFRRRRSPCPEGQRLPL
ncbi:MAG: endolytic transglycosylase MltG [Quisquiliibacterium sp.]